MVLVALSQGQFVPVTFSRAQQEQGKSKIMWLKNLMRLKMCARFILLTKSQYRKTHIHGGQKVVELPKTAPKKKKYRYLQKQVTKSKTCKINVNSLLEYKSIY